MKKLRYKKSDNQGVIAALNDDKAVDGAVVLPIIEDMSMLDSVQKKELSIALIQLEYDNPVRTLAKLGSRMFAVLNGIYINITGNMIGGEEGFPLLEAYQRAQKLEISEAVRSKEGEGPVKHKDR